MDSMNSSDGLRIAELTDTGDQRGRSFQTPSECLARLSALNDIHIASIRPGAVRGNHCHRVRREAIAVIYNDTWSVHWDSGTGTEVHRRQFAGAGVVLLEVEPECSHAVRNDGSSELWIIGLSDIAYNPERPDVHLRAVV